VTTSVSVYTTHDQTEQPLIIQHVTALSMVADCLFIEADAREKGYTYSAFHRFEPYEWTHYEAYHW
jgi:hypothetical protein